MIAVLLAVVTAIIVIAVTLLGIWVVSEYVTEIQWQRSRNRPRQNPAERYVERMRGRIHKW